MVCFVVFTGELEGVGPYFALQCMDAKLMRR